MDLDFESQGTIIDIDVENPVLLSEKLNTVTDHLESLPLNQASIRCLPELHAFLKHWPQLPLGLLPRLFDILFTSLSNLPSWLQEPTKPFLPKWVTLAGKMIQATELRTIHLANEANVSKLAAFNATNPSHASRSSYSQKKGKKRARTSVSSMHPSSNGTYWDEELFDWEALKLRSLQVFHQIVAIIPLSQYFTNSERETIVSAIASCLSELLQNKDRTSWKNHALKDLIMKIYAECILKHGHDAITSIEQNLRFFEFLAEPMAEFMVFLESQPTPSTVISDLLTRLAQTEFSDFSHAKSVATFLITLSELAPRTLLRHLIYLQSLLECPEFQLRSAMVHCIGKGLALCLDSNPTTTTTIHSMEDTSTHFMDQATAPKLLDILKERFKDSASQVRRKVIQIIGNDLLAHSFFYVKYPTYWMDFMQLTASRLLDKTQPVRSAAIKTLTHFLIQHPFHLHEGELFNVEYIQTQSKEVQLELSELLNDEKNIEKLDQARLALLEKKHAYYNDLMVFLNALQLALPNLIQLLASKSKVEVLETMDFLVVAVQMHLPKAQQALSSIWHLVYNVRNTDYVKDIHAHIIECFDTLYLKDQSPETIVKHLVTLTYHASLADRTCLERILVMCMDQELIPSSVLQLLWSLFSTHHASFPIQQRRGAALLLSWMITSHQLESASHLAMILKVLKAKEDYLLLTHACKMLQSNTTPFTPSSELLKSLIPLLLDSTHAFKETWFTFAQTAIKTIYLKCTQPMLLLNTVIDQMAPSSAKVSVSHLSRFCFLLGQIAIQQLVYLDKMESNYKKSKTDGLNNQTDKDKEHSKEKGKVAKKKDKGNNPSSKEGDDDTSELDHVVGSVEDVFTEHMHAIREMELLYGSKSVFAKYAPLIVALAERATGPLKVFAATCMAQFMCVSMQFCESQLPLLLHLTQPPYTFPLSANLMIALGDLTVCWSTLMSNANTSPLYDALDSEVHLRIKKNALMVLLHLILNGMVKVKGQLGHLALCLEDKDPTIRGLTHLFFSELASKDHALANQLTDVLSHLIGYQSHPFENEEDKIRKVLKTLFSCLIVPREKFFENLLDKLGSRFKDSFDEDDQENESEQEKAYMLRVWKDVAYCISLIQVDSATEMKIKKFMEYLPFILDKLNQDEFIYKSLIDWLHRALKACPNSLIIQECIEKIKQSKEESMTDKSATSTGVS